MVIAIPFGKTVFMWFGRSQFMCPVKTKSCNPIKVGLCNPAFANKPLPYDFVLKFFITALRYNAYYVSDEASTHNKKHIRKCVFHRDGTIDIWLETALPIPEPNRSGNCLRQFSVYMMDVGGQKYLSKSKRGKLFRRV